MEDDIQNYLSTVMFRGTPCMSQINPLFLHKLHYQLNYYTLPVTPFNHLVYPSLTIKLHPSFHPSFHQSFHHFTYLQVLNLISLINPSFTKPLFTNNYHGN